MPAATIYARADDDILFDAVVSGTAPLTSYTLDTLITVNPAARVRFGATTVTVTFTLSTARQGDIFVLVTSNLDPGTSPATLTLTNNAGLSELVPIAALQANGIPNTTILDLTLAEPNASVRTASVWNLVIVGNSVNVILGGAVLIYGPKRTLDPDLRWGFNARKLHAVLDIKNEYLTRYRYNYQTVERSLDVSVRTPGSAVGDMADWYDANAGAGLTGLVWPVTGIVSGLDAYVGTWQEKFVMTQVPGVDYYDVDLAFEELSKGQPF